MYFFMVTVKKDVLLSKNSIGISRVATAGAAALKVPSKGGGGGVGGKWTVSRLNRRLAMGFDKIPPGPISRLKLVETRLETGEATLQWIAAGDNFDVGRPKVSMLLNMIWSSSSSLSLLLLCCCCCCCCCCCFCFFVVVVVVVVVVHMY